MDETSLDYLRELAAFAVKFKIQSLTVGTIGLTFSADAFRPDAPARPTLTDKEREELAKKQRNRRVYGSSLG